ncbi:hypothetical protein GY21_00020 [Cryobacterium roopkundense]|uniref:DNA methylase adenine-specific domain-containing protein n=1 Tax=Cryobacterium roopkundense TaxID=1001240 RepID=A0A099JZF3_9MICO|nr:hypothetical protein [Cryobacterium roopkundense]KGJ82783.1 hypothetical protein GY21_00020 [Cryobacterium roopkundense]MBB5640956.1 hypothetical protein [Cryobacterium roopkundense]
MTITEPGLLMTMSDIAALAHVQRPVVSMWRTRAALTDSPFPTPILRQRGVDLFDAHRVGSWLRDTGRGNNPQAAADAAAYAVLAATGGSDESAFRSVTALLALRAASDQALGGLSVAGLLDAADEHDPDDEMFFREIEAIGASLPAVAGYVDALVEAAFGVGPAFERILADRTKRDLADEGDLMLSGPALELVAETVTALRLTQAAESVLADPTGSASDLLLAIHAAQGGELSVTTANDARPAARLQRRRLLVHGISRRGLDVLPSGAFTVSGAAVHVAQYPSANDPAMSAVKMLSSIEQIVLQMTNDQLAVVIAPSPVLSDAGLSREAEELRSSLLRSGRVRAIVRLPAGLLTRKPQQLQALWVLGAAHAHVSLADRWTMVADLTATPLDGAVIDDLVGDLAASLGDRKTVRAHAFRFARLVLTRSLLASRQSLVAGALTATSAAAWPAAARAVAVDRLIVLLNDDTIAAVNVPVQPAAGDPADSSTVGELLSAGHLRYFSGNRIAAGDVISGAADAAGIRLIGPAEIAGQTVLGSRRIDRLRFAAAYPSGRVTEPGDLVFCTSPKPAALVDTDGTAVVVFPARILRIDPGNTNGLLGEVLAADIDALPPGHRRWRAWPVRQVRKSQENALAQALTSIRLEQKRARDRLGHLDELSALLMAGVTAGTLTLASEIPAPEEGTP